MGETPIYDSLVGELGDTLAEVRALFSQHIVDDQSPGRHCRGNRYRPARGRRRLSAPISQPSP